MGDALRFAKRIKEHDNCVEVRPAARHWDIFTRLWETGKVSGGLVTDGHPLA